MEIVTMFFFLVVRKIRPRQLNVNAASTRILLMKTELAVYNTRIVLVFF